MKNIAHLLFLFLLNLITTGSILGNVDNVKEVKWYTSDQNYSSIPLKMDYGKWEIKNIEVYNKYKEDHIIKEIDIVFTLYPFKSASWQEEYQYLLKARLQALKVVAPELIDNPNVKINVIMQTAGNSEISARKFFHGIVLKYASRNSVGNVHIISSEKSLSQTNQKSETEKLQNEVESMVYGLSEFRDSTVLKVIDRNPWKKMLVVTDWTGSMYPYGSQVALWHRLNFDKDIVSGYVFFNDGNRKSDREKRPGLAGGVYYCKPPTIDSLLSLMNFVMKMGSGGDIPENNIEALLRAQFKGGAEDEIIMIADNNANVRDIALLSKIKKPVRIILCNVPCGVPIHPHYLTIAQFTKGSIHTMHQDIYDVLALKIGTSYEINGILYKIKKGRFEQVISRALY